MTPTSRRPAGVMSGWGYVHHSGMAAQSAVSARAPAAAGTTAAGRANGAATDDRYPAGHRLAPRPYQAEGEQGEQLAGDAQRQHPQLGARGVERYETGRGVPGREPAHHRQPPQPGRQREQRDQLRGANRPPGRGRGGAGVVEVEADVGAAGCSLRARMRSSVVRGLWRGVSFCSRVLGSAVRGPGRGGPPCGGEGLGPREPCERPPSCAGCAPTYASPFVRVNRAGSTGSVPPLRPAGNRGTGVCSGCAGGCGPAC